MEASFVTPPSNLDRDEASSRPSPPVRAARLALRIAMIVVVTWAFGWILNKSATAANDRAIPAGFGRGMIHGALMPGAMPSLLFGHDVVIYASNNNGRLYKLGYTCGVNAAGAFFFGSFYLRVSRWRKRINGSPTG